MGKNAGRSWAANIGHGYRSAAPQKPPCFSSCFWPVFASRREYFQSKDFFKAEKSLFMV